MMEENYFRELTGVAGNDGGVNVIYDESPESRGEIYRQHIRVMQESHATVDSPEARMLLGMNDFSNPEVFDSVLRGLNRDAKKS